MKAMVCEMCNGNNFLKDGDFFVCQSCGTKYTPEAAKKLMVEGTVKVDNSEKVEKLLKAAQMARKNNDSETAQKNYNLVLAEDPEQWEAVFFSIYYKAEKTNILNMASAMASVENCLKNIFQLIKLNVADENEQVEAVKTLFVYILKLGALMETVARKQFAENYNIQYDHGLRRFKDYANRSDAVSNTYMTFVAYIADNYPSNEELKKIQAIAEKASIQLKMDKVYVYDDPDASIQIFNKLASLYIIPSDPDYKLPEPNTNGFPARYKNLINEKIGKKQEKNGGCYVATCVYGSYDCPQVWTLRRYRDETLAATWYGRAFIRVYYAVSPTFVKWFGETKWFRTTCQFQLDRMVRALNRRGVENTPYQDKEW